MKTVFLVDDEPLVTDTIGALVDWDSFGMRICGTANDGFSARLQILEKCPDLVIADIRMPGLSGLDLIASIQDQLPNTLFVIISGYNDFAYIRTALRLNIMDYLDKPVTVEKIQSMLVEAKQIFDKRQALATEENRDGDARRQMRRMLSDPPTSRADLPEELAGLRFLHVLAISGNSEFCRGELAPVLTRALSPMGIDVLVIEKEKEEGFLSVGWSAQPYETGKVCCALEKALARFFASGILTAIGASRCHETLCDLKNACLEALCAREYAEFFEDEIVEISSIRTANEGQTDLIYRDHLSLFLRTGEWQKAEDVVEEILNQMEETRLSPDIVRHICLGILYQSISICSETGSEYLSEGHPFLPHVKIGAITRAGDVRIWTKETFHQIVCWLRERREQTRYKDIARAKHYIDDHYGEAITLRMLADMCYMNPNYFSAVFRDNVGMTYVKYLNAVRMERAKELLQAGQKIKVISGCYNL